MSEQLTLDADASRSAANEAIERVERNADPTWKAEAWVAILTVARTQHIFTGDDVWATGLERPHEPRALGPLMRRAMKAGVCRKTGRMVPSNVPKDHRNPHYEWESLIYKED